MRAIRILLLAVSLVGGVSFAALFAASLANPGYVEEVAREIIRHRVEKKVNEKIEALNARFLGKKAAALAKAHGDEVLQIQQQLREGLPERIAFVIAQMRNLDCECRKKIEKTIREGFESQIANAAHAREQLTAFIQAQYMATADKLTREFRIFTGSNALVFALLGGATLAKRRAGLHLLPAAVVLLVAAAVTSYCYLFQQDWLHTILFNDYLGFAFVGYLVAVFGFLCDILFNRAKVTAELLNGLLNAIGSGIQVLPC